MRKLAAGEPGSPGAIGQSSYYLISRSNGVIVVVLRCYCLVILDTTAAPGVFLICYQSKPGLRRDFSLVSTEYRNTVPSWPLSLKLGISLCRCGCAVPTRALPNGELEQQCVFFHMSRLG
ncbi:hypothetical protein DUI87_12921 [Hirundo rustica rustica]|uniref:Uncharacterized protein n=1 Tax=Hirundo rustica rustica TaxID=333673 RepID=A0A3M0KAA2_HIRRU|nr:hypothetical protein DUI87_12921 [Hirundo rustica rustica]